MLNKELYEAVRLFSIEKGKLLKILGHVEGVRVSDVLQSRMTCGCQRGYYLNQLVGNVLANNLTPITALELLLGQD